MEFVRGTFQKLEAQTTVHLGRLEKNLSKGDIVEFDGFTLKFAGLDTTMPELKAGIKRGWLKIFEGEAEVTVEKVAQAPSPAKKEMKIETVYDEERTVAEIKPSTPKKEEEPKARFPLVVESADEDMITVSKVNSKSGAEVSSASSASDGVAESQGAESVGKIKIKTASKQKTVISDGSQASSEIARLDNMSREAVASEVKSEDPDVEDLGLDGILDDIGGEETTSPMEEQAKEASQILAAVDGDVQPTQGAITVGEDNSKIKALPVGIDWDMSPHWRKRASTALELYRDHPEILDAIKSVETKGVIKAINKGLEG